MDSLETPPQSWPRPRQRPWPREAPVTWARQVWECVRESTRLGKGEKRVVSEVAVPAPCSTLRTCKWKMSAWVSKHGMKGRADMSKVTRTVHATPSPASSCSPRYPRGGWHAPSTLSSAPRSPPTDTCSKHGHNFHTALSTTAFHAHRHDIRSSRQGSKTPHSFGMSHTARPSHT